MVHHDAAPWNLVRGERWVLVDWDGAGPGSRTWDLAYAAHGVVPLSPSTDPVAAGLRLAALADGYGLDEAGRVALAEALHRRVLSMWTLLRDGHRTGTEPWARLWQSGHGDVWAANAAWVEEQQALLRAALLG